MHRHQSRLIPQATFRQFALNGLREELGLEIELSLSPTA